MNSILIPEQTTPQNLDQAQSESQESTNPQPQDWDSEPDKFDRTDIDFMITCVVLVALGMIAIGAGIGLLLWYFWR